MSRYMLPPPSSAATSARDEMVVPSSRESEIAPQTQPAEFSVYYDADETASELVRTRAQRASY